jgi:GDP-L-fucose synthase
MKAGERRGIPFSGKILVTGDRGFLATHCLTELEKRWIFADFYKLQGTSFFDLTRPNHVSTLFNSIETNHGPIRTVIHFAAMSGGIADNIQHQGRYWYNNMMMGINMLEECAKPNRVVQKLIMFLGGCSYPDQKDRTDPFREEELWDGLPVETSMGYSFAKKSLIVGAWAYEKEFGLKTSFLLPTNPIGEFDNVTEEQSHAPMAFIRKFIEARDEGYGTVTLFGTGKPVRDFIDIKDIAKIFPDLVADFDELGPLNISTGKGTTIEELATMISKAVGYTGTIRWDTNKPDGQLHKTLAPDKLIAFLDKKGIKWEPTPLSETIPRVVEWYERRVWKK